METPASDCPCSAGIFDDESHKNVVGGARAAAGKDDFHAEHVANTVDHHIRHEKLSGCDVKLTTIPAAGVHGGMCVAKIYVPTGISENLAPMSPGRTNFPWAKTPISLESYVTALCYIHFYLRFTGKGTPGLKKSGMAMATYAVSNRIYDTDMAFTEDGTCVYTIKSTNNMILRHIRSLLSTPFKVTSKAVNDLKRIASAYSDVYDLTGKDADLAKLIVPGNIRKCADAIDRALLHSSVILAGSLGSLNPDTKKRPAAGVLAKISDKIISGLAARMEVDIPSTRKAPKGIARPAASGKPKKAPKPGKEKPEVRPANFASHQVDAKWTPANGVCTVRLGSGASGFETLIAATVTDAVFFAGRIPDNLRYNVAVSGNTVTFSTSSDRISQTVRAIVGAIGTAGADQKNAKRFASVIGGLVKSSKRHRDYAKNFMLFCMLNSHYILAQQSVIAAIINTPAGKLIPAIEASDMVTKTSKAGVTKKKADRKKVDARYGKYALDIFARITAEVSE
jgi:hypothetical protein